MVLVLQKKLNDDDDDVCVCLWQEHQSKGGVLSIESKSSNVRSRVECEYLGISFIRNVFYVAGAPEQGGVRGRDVGQPAGAVGGRAVAAPAVAGGHGAAAGSVRQAPLAQRRRARQHGVRRGREERLQVLDPVESAPPTIGMLPEHGLPVT